jgi:hypothetical protein
MTGGERIGLIPWVIRMICKVASSEKQVAIRPRYRPLEEGNPTNSGPIATNCRVFPDSDGPLAWKSARIRFGKSCLFSRQSSMDRLTSADR